MLDDVAILHWTINLRVKCKGRLILHWTSNKLIALGNINYFNKSIAPGKPDLDHSRSG